MLDKVFSGMKTGKMFHKNKKKLLPMYPTYLLFQITKRCNSRCIMCDFWKKKPKDELDEKEIEKMFRSSVIRDLHWLSLTGGEPFLSKNLLNVCKYASRLKKLEKISIPTNGILTDSILEQVKELRRVVPRKIGFKVNVSIDGIGKVHDEIRGKGVFEKAVKTIECLSRMRGIDYGILVLINKKNCSSLDGLYRYLKKKSDNITFTVQTNSPYFSDEDKSIFTDEENKNILRFLDFLMKHEPRKSYVYSVQKDIINMNKRTYPCLWGYLSMYIDSEGSVYPCHYLGEKFKIGNVKERSLEDIWMNDDFRRKIKNIPYCKRCSNNCDLVNIVRSELYDFAGYALTHPGVLFHINPKNI